MNAVKRVEIVIASQLLERLVEALRRARASGYTVISGASGAGERGTSWGDDPGGSSENHVVICVVDEEHLGAVVEAVRPLLERFGGICLVSDATWIHH